MTPHKAKQYSKLNIPENYKVGKFEDLSKHDQLVFMAYKLGLPIEFKALHWGRWVSWQAASGSTPDHRFDVTIHVMSLRIYDFRIKTDAKNN